MIDLLPSVPTPVWGRDELGAGEMWNSNSVVSWVLCRAGIDLAPFVMPAGGRAPGWDAGIVVAAADPVRTRDELTRHRSERSLARSDAECCGDRVRAVGEGGPLVVVEHLNHAAMSSSVRMSAAWSAAWSASRAIGACS